MADAFPVSGNIDPTSFPHLLVDLHRRGATGSLKVVGPVHPKALYFRGGRILFGSSNDPRDQLGAILIESGKITREQLDEVNGKVGPGNPLAKVLAESGFVNQRELGDAARVKVERILSDVVSWKSGSFEFEDGVLPKGAVDLKLSTARLLLAAVQRVGERSFALRHLGGDTSVVLEPTPDSEALLADVRAEVWPLLERLDGQRTLQDAIALTRLDEFDAAKTACALLFMGIARAKEGVEADELDLAQEARSGLVGEAAEPEPVLLPSEEPEASSPVIDAEPARAEPVDAAAAETVQFVPEAEPGSEPVVPAPIPEPEAAPLPNLDPTGFAFVEAEEPPPAEPAPSEVPEPTVSPPLEPTVALPPEPPPPTFEPEPPPPTFEPEPPSPTFERVPPPPGRFDTLPGDQPAYVPSAAPFPDPSEGRSGESPSADRSSPDSSARPTKEDLAALDALLNPSGTGGTERPPVRPRSDTWEPQFRTGTTAPRRAAVSRSAPPSRAPLIGGAVVVLLAVVAGGYYFLFGRSPEAVTTPAAPVTAPTMEPTPTLSAPATVAPAATPTPAAALAATPVAAVVPTPTPVPTPPPVAAVPPPQAAPPPTGEPGALLRQGSLDAAARGFAASLAAGPPGRYGIQALVACSPETVMKAVQGVGDDALFILPVSYKGRDCHRICWGVYPDRAAAEAAARSFPAYFRENRIQPRIQPLPDLLP